MTGVFGFRRIAWRDAWRPAPDQSLSGYVLAGPAGVVATHLETATGPLRRARGLLGRDELEAGSALLIAPCSQVHTVGMRFAIDAVFCDRDLRVLVVRTLEAGKLASGVRGAWCCVELPSGAAARAGIERGDQLRLRPADGE